MKDQDKIPQEYQKGFNDGYLIAEHVPDLAEKLSRTSGDSLRITGLKDGIEQSKREKKKDVSPKWLRKDRLSSSEKGSNLSKKKEKDGPDKD